MHPGVFNYRNKTQKTSPLSFFTHSHHEPTEHFCKTKTQSKFGPMAASQRFFQTVFSQRQKTSTTYPSQLSEQLVHYDLSVF